MCRSAMLPSHALQVAIDAQLVTACMANAPDTHYHYCIAALAANMKMWRMDKNKMWNAAQWSTVAQQHA